MFAHDESWDVEEICYDSDHVVQVVEAIRKNFSHYFGLFIQTEAGTGISDESFRALQSTFGTVAEVRRSSKDEAKAFKRIISDAISDYEKDRQKYLAIFDKETLEELADDPAYFKSQTLKIDCPIIHSTLFNRHAKELDKYRKQFSIASPQKLLSVVTSLYEFAERYMAEVYDADSYDDIESLEDLALYPLDDEDEYTAYGVIGGGIKSHMLYKIYPCAFPNRSRNALWALWYLTDKKSFGCQTDSEFLMIDVEKSITQQNYFYPYGLFTLYAQDISCLLKQKAVSMNVFIDPDYRYVITDAFLEFIAKQHQDETDYLKSQIRDGGMGYV